VIIAVAANSQHNTELSSIVVYALGLLSMLGFSAAYNTWPVSPAKRVPRRFGSLRDFPDDRGDLHTIHSSDER
jgi:predicted membrane channel-forming protein YqfA (hemolysin III family)